MSSEAERFKKMVEGSQDWFWEFDENAIFTYASPRIKDLLGYEPEELIGLNAFDLMDADEAERVRRHFDPIAQKYLPFNCLVNINIHKDGHKVVIESSGTPIFDDQGCFRGYRGIDRDITSRKYIEEALLESQALLNETEHIAHVGSWKLDLASNILSWSDEVYRIFGLVPQEFGASYEAFLDTVHPDDRAAVDAAYSGSLRDGQNGYEIEHRIIRKKSGEIRHVHERCIHKRDADGTVVCSLGMVQDITERRQAEKLLQENTAKINTILETSTEWIWETDLTGRHTYTNDSLRVFLGYSAKEFLGRDYKDFLHADDLVEVARVLPLYIKEKRGWQGWLLRWRHKDGSYRWLESNAKPIIDASGQISGFRGADRDVTERKRIEAELQHSKEKLNDIVTLLPQSIYEADSAGRVTFANQAAFELFGYSKGDFSAGLNVLDMVIPEDVDRARETIGKMYMGAEEGGHEYTARRKDGTTFPVIIYSSIVKKEGSPCGMRGIIVDISKRKKYEQELEQARDMAQSMNRAKDEFLANMSHELRTPITAVLGFTELLQGTELSEQQQKYLSTIDSSAETLLALVNDLLDLAKIEAGKVYLEREEFCLRSLIDEIANSQKPAARAKGLAFKTRVAAEVPAKVLGDPLRLQQILLNLTVNAIKFSEMGEVCLSVSVEDFHPSTPLLRFDVSDTGIGISSEDITKIFQPFSQVDPSLTRKFGGAGLGLAISKKLLEIMGGEISATSFEGGGSTFHVLLPFEVADLEAESGGAHHAGQATTQEGIPLQVLVVEDHKASQYFFAEALKRCGHHVDLAENGAEALGKLQCRTYDLVLMDVQMPIMDGFETISKIRDMEKAAGRHLPVIALTAHAMEKDRIEVLSKGFDGYVSKPMKINELLDEVKRCLPQGQ
jgi:PAS domain S-box-containing protein